MGTPVAAVKLARNIARFLPRPDLTGFLPYWGALAALDSVDLGVDKIIEPHLDAPNILDETGSPSTDDRSIWVVFAARSIWVVFAAEGSWHHLQTGSIDNNHRTLTGTEPRCSPTTILNNVIVTAHTETIRRACAVDLRQPGFSRAGSPWAACGLVEVPRRTLSFDEVAAIPIADVGWSFDRPGSPWCGIGVAAIWHGAMFAIARRLFEYCTARTPGHITLLHLDEANADIHRSAIPLRIAAVELGESGGASTQLTAVRTRAVVVVVVAKVEIVMAVAAHGLGPAPLTFEAEHAKRIADLSLCAREDS
ncbi:hypothetical protein [Arthrobacter psychrolactophilus]|uniref:hypothetical protein n=1 Tax=Arthrobacter psychrolactophilus TaxID=92442 RepID=UPI001C651004|nr:hypothetical protein [Arthrobacter psychrolactophilus]